MCKRIVGGMLVCLGLLFLAPQQGRALLADTWGLPQGLAVKDSSPRTYRFTIEYKIADSRGSITRSQRLVAEYTRGLPNGVASWKNIFQDEASGASGEYGPAQKREFMEGFRYRNHSDNSLSPGFFKGFPDAAIYERNLVWDTEMLEHFGQDYFEHLKLNEAYTSMANQDVPIPGFGTFQNTKTKLTWVGKSSRNGQECAVIEYQAFFNPLELATGGMKMRGRSDYWGEIWVSLATKQIEYATLYENVIGEMSLPGSTDMQPLHVFRVGVFEPVESKGLR